MSLCLSLLTLVRRHARRLAETAREVEPGAGKARSPVERRRPRWWRAARGGCGTSGRNALLRQVVHARHRPGVVLAPVLIGQRGRAVGVEALDGLQAPGLAILALLLGPD